MSRLLKFSYLLFILDSVLLFGYLYSLLSFRFSLGIYFFWGLILMIYGILFTQILCTKNSWVSAGLILIELIILNLLLHSIFQIPFESFFGIDAHFEYISLTLILDQCFSFQSPLPLTSYWPMIHIYGATFQLLTGLNLVNAAKVTPFLLELSLPLLLYILFQKIISLAGCPKAREAALLSILFYITISNHIEFSSYFIRQTIALPIFVLIFYLFIAYLEKSSKRYIVLEILLIVALTFAHHFLGFILLVLLIVFTLIQGVLHKKLNGASHILIVSCVVLGYWTYLVQFPLNVIVNTFQDLLLYQGSSYIEVRNIDATSFAYLREVILLYGFFLFHGIFSIIILVKLNILKRLVPYIAILFTCGIIGVFLLFGPVSIFPDRILLIGWIFGSVPLIVAILSMKKSYRQISMIVVFMFLLYNVYYISPAFYSSPEDVYSHPTAEDYRIVSIIDMREYNVLAHTNIYAATLDIYHVETNRFNQKEIFSNLTDNVRMSDLIFLDSRFIEIMKADYSNKIDYSASIASLRGELTTTQYSQILDSTYIKGYVNMR